MPAQLPRARPQLVLVAPADHQYFDVGKLSHQCGECCDEHGHALAGLVEPTEEQHRLAGAGVAVEPGSGRERRDVDTVGDLDGVAAQSFHLPAPRQIGHRDPADDLLVHRPQERFEHRERQRLRGGRVERRDDRPLGDVQRQHRQARCVRFVQVQHVEIALLEPLLDLAVGGGAESQTRHRTVVSNRNRLAARDDVVGQRLARRR